MYLMHFHQIRSFLYVYIYTYDYVAIRTPW